ncbi:hypothetical protein [Lacisediminihabitans profunda]|uniref:Uncharacterized protein n=1 Tax=Lacisediminihabitans profunda TaxID=2594790 RepID=A0A5C8UPG3_9MICO|nr:hypothetical protein [Lacisediminihabitans profunda]TXN29771.1 hypothetical protein FVP33_11520 [Lacisediminihabitans profunda]
MARTIEATFLGGPSAGNRPVEVTNSGRLPELIAHGAGVYKLSPSPTTWDGDYHYQNAEYRWSEK